MKISSNTLVLNEVHNIDGLITNLVDANIDEIIILDGGSTDGTYEKLLELEKKYKNLLVLRWKQPFDSEYKGGWREKDRRNIMLDISEGEYIISVDADERISLNIKEKIEELYKKNVDGIVINLYHFWGKDSIRVNTEDDLVWSPEPKLRIIRNEKNIRYGSDDPNGLHNYISKNGFRVRTAMYSKSTMKKLMAYLYRSLLRFKIYECNDIKLYHLHYIDLSKMKKNDLRKFDLENCDVIYVNDINEGIKYNREKDKKICIVKKDIFDDIQKYI